MPGRREEWRAVPGYPRYEVSTRGRVRSYALRDRHVPGKRSTRPHPLKPMKRPDGYLQVKLSSDDGVSKTFKLHRLVLLTWVGLPPGDWTASHMNGKGDDCRLENLAWESQKVNASRQSPHGTIKRKVRGEDHHSARFTAAQVLEIRALHPTAGTIVLARRYGVSTTTIKNIVRRKVWRHI